MNIAYVSLISKRVVVKCRNCLKYSIYYVKYIYTCLAVYSPYGLLHLMSSLMSRICISFFLMSFLRLSNLVMSFLILAWSFSIPWKVSCLILRLSYSSFSTFSSFWSLVTYEELILRPSLVILSWVEFIFNEI